MTRPFLGLTLVCLLLLAVPPSSAAGRREGYSTGRPLALRLGDADLTRRQRTREPLRPARPRLASSAPSSAAFTPPPACLYPFVYVSDFGASSISILDPAVEDMRDGVVDVGQTPLGIAVNSAGDRAWVANFGNATVSIIDTESRIVVQTLGSELSPFDVVFSQDGTRVFVSCLGAGSVLVYEEATGRMLERIFVGGEPSALAITDGLLWVAEQLGEQVVVIDVDDSAILDRIDVGELPRGLAASDDGDRIWVANFEDDRVSVIDASSRTVLQTIRVGEGPRGLAFDGLRERLFVSNARGDSVSVIDTVASTVLRTIAVGSAPFDIILDRAGSTVYVTNSFDDTLSVIDADTLFVTGTLPTGTFPRGLAVQKGCIDE